MGYIQYVSYDILLDRCMFGSMRTDPTEHEVHAQRRDGDAPKDKFWNSPNGVWCSKCTNLLPQLRVKPLQARELEDCMAPESNGKSERHGPWVYRPVGRAPGLLS